MSSFSPSVRRCGGHCHLLCSHLLLQRHRLWGAGGGDPALTPPQGLYRGLSVVRDSTGDSQLWGTLQGTLSCEGLYRGLSVVRELQGTLSCEGLYRDSQQTLIFFTWNNYFFCFLANFDSNILCPTEALKFNGLFNEFYLSFAWIAAPHSYFFK